MAALLLGRLLVRPDQGPALREFLVWSRESLLSPQDTLAASFLVPGTWPIYQSAGSHCLLCMSLGHQGATTQWPQALHYSTQPGRMPGVMCVGTPAPGAGTLQTLCFVFKLGQRERLLPHASAVWAQLQELRGSTGASGSAAAAGGAGGVLARKLCVKLAQRVCLTFLEPRLAPWR
jgi:hypothetical protein